MPLNRTFRRVLIGSFTAGIVAASFAGCSSDSKKKLFFSDGEAGESGAQDPGSAAGSAGAGDATGNGAGAGNEAGAPPESSGGDSMAGGEAAGGGGRSGAAGSGTATGGTGGATANGGTSAGGAATAGGGTSAGGAATAGGGTSAGGAATVGGGTSAGGAATAGGGTSAGGAATAGGGTSAGGAATAGGGTSAGGAANGGTSGGTAVAGSAGSSQGGALGGGGSAGSSALAGGTGGNADACATPGSNLILAFDTADSERVTNLQWIESASVTTTNLVAQGGPLTCSDPIEYFGQAYGAEGQLPAPVVPGHVATLTGCGFDVTITGAVTDCNDAPQFPVTTKYHRYTGVQANQVRVTRTFAGLNGSTPGYPQNILRAYVPRLPVAQFPSVMYPNQLNTAITTAPITGCATDCLVSVGATWSGRWFADLDPASGRAMIVLRDPAMTFPTRLAGNNDGYSASNLTSFQLFPIDGWPTLLTEVEYLCFEDLTTWPQVDRDAAKLPAGCGP